MIYAKEMLQLQVFVMWFNTGVIPLCISLMRDGVWLEIPRIWMRNETV